VLALLSGVCTYGHMQRQENKISRYTATPNYNWYDDYHDSHASCDSTERILVEDVWVRGTQRLPMGYSVGIGLRQAVTPALTRGLIHVYLDKSSAVHE
jgi:hypothetical protein